MVKGSITQCPYCGASTLYMESVYSFKYYLGEIINLTLMKNERAIKKEELERRKSSIETFFHKLNSSFNEYRHLIITKLDDIDIDPVNIFNLIRSAGNFEIIIEKFLMNHLKEDKVRKKYQQLRDLSYIINKSLLGLYYSYLAKRSARIENCCKYYQLAERNYQNIVDYCNISRFENNDLKVYKNRELYSVLANFARILKSVLNENPKYFSEKLEALLNELNEIEEKNIRMYNLYTQIENIYKLERDTCVLLEKVRIDNPIPATDSVNENIIFNTEENIDELNKVRNCIKENSEKYQKYQRNLLKLHSGRLIKYLELYRDEFINVKNKNVEKFDDLLGEMITTALETYNMETVEALDVLSDFMQKEIFEEDIIKRFEIEHEDLIKMDEILMNFINNLFKKPLLRSFESEYYKKLISLISGKHSEFDKYILKYINKLLKKFEEVSSKKVLSLEEQRNQFSSEIKPNLKKLVDLSFTLNEKVLPYPLFIDVKIQNKKLKIHNTELITLTIENPNLTDIRDVKIYFFMPNSFDSKLSYTSIKKLKAYERRKLKARIIPRECGTFLFMVMIEYQHVNKTFWMPSIKLELEVEDDIKYRYYPILNKSIFYTGLYATQSLELVRIFI